MFLPKILCRIQVWVRKIGLPTGQMTFDFFKNYIDVTVIKSQTFINLITNCIPISWKNAIEEALP